MSNTMPPNKKNNDANISGNHCDSQRQQEPLSEKADNQTKASSTENIMQLPLRKIQAGEKLYQGYYDEEKLILYLADENGRLIGKTASLPKPLPPIKHEEPSAKEGTSESVRDVKNALQKTHENVMSRKKETSGIKNTYKMVAIVAAVIVLLLVAVIIGFRMSISLYMDKKHDTVPIPNENEIMVIEVKGDILPGDVISEDNLQAANINSQTYNQIAINGNDLYRWEQKDNILGMYAAEYISQGHYITTNAVTKVYKGYENPWSVDGDALAYADIPIDITEFDRTELLIGKKVNLRFQVDQKEENASSTLPSVTDGIKVIQEDNVTTTKSYAISNVIISNILTANNDGLFEVYSSLISIPEGNREHYLKKTVKYNKEYIPSITPAKIQVIIDKEYAQELQRSVLNGLKTEIELTDEKDISTQEKKEFYDNEVSLTETLSEVIK